MQPSPYAPPYSSEPAAVSPTAGRSHARMRIVVPVAVITALLVIAGAANQWTTKQMLKCHGEVLLYLSRWLTYSWRFTPGPWEGRYFASQLALIGTTLLLTGLLVWCLLRGPITWGRAFFGTWLAVLFATVVGAIVRGFVAPDDVVRVPGSNRVTEALFGVLGPSNGPVFAGLVLGLIVALVTSLVALASRRPEAPAARPLPPGPPSFADYAPPPPSRPGGPPPWQDQHYGPPPGDQPTTQLPPPAEAPERPSLEKPTDRPTADGENRPESQPTTQLPPPPVAPEGPPTGPSAARETPPTAPATPPAATPSASPPPGSPSGPPPGSPSGPPPGEQATTRFPRPPDDEDLGHIEH